MSEIKIRDEKVAFNNLGRDIKNARKTMRITREVLARMLNIDLRYLANIENYHQLPSLPLFYRIAVICNLPIEQYFFDKDMEDVELQMLINSMSNCPKQYRAIMRSLLEELRRLEQPEKSN